MHQFPGKKIFVGGILPLKVFGASDDILPRNDPCHLVNLIYAFTLNPHSKLINTTFNYSPLSKTE